MTPEAQRIAIAEACGWMKHREIEPGEWIWIHPMTGLVCGQSLIPDYLCDLNAMHRAELSLAAWSGDVGKDEYGRYLGWLEHVTRGSIGWKNSTSATMRLIVSATAAQRAEAFLRTIGKWLDEPVNT